MCRPRAGEVNQLFSVYIALWRSTALAIIYNVVERQRNLGLTVLWSVPVSPRWVICLSKWFITLCLWLYCTTGVNKSPSPTPGASNFHIWASWNYQLYARRASKNIYRILTNLSIFAYLLISYIHICYMLFNQQQCFIYSTASFLSKLRAKKVEKLRILVIKQLQQTTAYRKFRKYQERLFPVLAIVQIERATQHYCFVLHQKRTEILKSIM
jgi:hypothetical protein